MSRSTVLSMLALLLATLTATATAAPIVYGVNAHDNRRARSLTGITTRATARSSHW
jgi:hypothetical protein